MEKRTRRINKEVAGGNKISSGNKRKARKSIFLPSHRVQMTNNYDNQFQSVKRGIVYLWSFLLLYCLASPLARVSSVTLASYLPILM